MDDWTYRILAVVSAAIFIPLLLAVFVGRPDPNHWQSPKRDRVFYTQFGSVYCGDMKLERCGVHLWNCTDDREFICLQGIAWTEVK